MHKECKICGLSNDLSGASSVLSTRGTTRASQNYETSVWRCVGCKSIHALEAVNHDVLYAEYPLHKQRLDWITRRAFANRLRSLKRGGLRRWHRVLDYGGGNGLFARFLREQGYSNAVTYDPYSKEFNDRQLISGTFDFVLCQDVIEHAEEPSAILAEIVAYAGKDGTVVVGTPNAEKIALYDPFDQAGALHQPFHRHIFSEEALVKAIGSYGYTVQRVERRWYFDTKIPLINARFIIEYWRQNGGVIDSGFEPINWKSISRRPRIWIYAFIGYWLSRQQDILAFAKAKA